MTILKWVMCNAGHGGAQRPKVYFSYSLSLEVWGSKGEWKFGLYRHRNYSCFNLYQCDTDYHNSTEAKEAAELWFSDWILNQFGVVE